MARSSPRIVQSVLKSVKSPRLGGRCPLTAFIGLRFDTPLLSIKHEIDGEVEVLPTDEVKARRMMKMEEILASLDQMNNDVLY